MNLIRALFRPNDGVEPPDGVCVVRIVAQQQHDLPPQHLPGMVGSAFKWRHPFGPKTLPNSDRETSSTKQQLPWPDLPALAANSIWEQLNAQDRRSLRLVQSGVRAVASHCPKSLQITSTREFGPSDMRKLDTTFPDLNRLELQLGPDAACSNSDATALLQELRRVRLPHLHTFSCDAKLRGDVLLAVARFLVHTPSLRVLQLPNQRACSPADQRLLCAVLEALPHLTTLDLGGAGSSSSGSSNAVSPSLMRRITKLLPQLRHLSCNAAAVPDEQLQALDQLPQLQSLSIRASGSGRGLVAGLARCSRLTSLEVEHPRLGQELVGCLAGKPDLQVLMLGLCPQLPDTILQEVCGLQQLHKLSLPFPVTSAHLQHLFKLPALSELLLFDSIELDVLGPAHEPLAAVTTVVTSSIHSHGKPLAALFPALQSVYLRSCGDMEALSLRSCGSSLAVLAAGDCGGLSDEGFAGLRSLRGLVRLQMDNAHQLSDLSFVAVFSSTMPTLTHVSLSGCSRITDAALQLLTASCRRLASITLSSCPQLSDKTLKRLSHCEHLSTVHIKSCPGVSSEGVAALLAAPQVKAVSVSHCRGVRRSQLPSCRAGVKLRVVCGRERKQQQASQEHHTRRTSDSSARSSRVS